MRAPTAGDGGAASPRSDPLAAAEGVDDALVRAVERFLFYESELLDDRRFEEWLDLFADDALYEAPLRLSREGQSDELSERGRIFWDTKETLAIRVQRLRSEYAWAEQPPSRTRHYVTNLRVGLMEGGAISARCNLLVYRNRGDDPSSDLYAADRRDVLVPSEVSGFRIRHRLIVLDQSNMTGNSMSIFL